MISTERYFVPMAASTEKPVLHRKDVAKRTFKASVPT
jgi:hypothetical protein